MLNRRIALFSAALPGWSDEQVIEIAQLLGFAAIEWGIGPAEAIPDGRSAAAARKRCDQVDICCGGVAVQDKGVTLGTPREAAAALDLALELGGPHVRVRAPRYEGHSLQRQQKVVQQGLNALVELAAPQGLAVLVETSPDTLASTPESALHLVEEHSPTEVGVLYDPGNMIIEGHVEPRLAIARLHQYLVHVHVKNVAWQRRGDTWHWEHSDLGAGLADWPAILRALATAGYSGLFSIDHLPGPPTESLMRREVEVLSALLDEAFGPTAGEVGALQ